MKHVAKPGSALLMMMLLLLPAMASPPVPEAAGPLSQLVIYAAKGPPDSCGPGCDRWISIEGKIEKGSAAKVERFFRERKDTERPVYFHSLGGEMRDSLAIGRLLRSRKAVGRVGRTVVDACPGTQIDDACTFIKNTRDEVTGSIATRGAVCGSACTFLLFGAATREVALDAAVAVHGPKVGIEFRLNMNEKFREEATAKARSEGLRLAFAYVEEMGISRELMTLADSISHESMHVLTRDELHRFRIDTRDFVETPWTFEKAPRGSVRKMALTRIGGAFRKLEWQFSCDSRAQVRLMFADEVGKDAVGTRVVAMTAGSAKPPQFARFPSRLGANEIWTAAITTEQMKGFLAVPRLGMGQSALLADGKPDRTSFIEIETRGLEAAWTQLSANCRAAPARPLVVRWPAPPAPSPRASEGQPSGPVSAK